MTVFYDEGDAPLDGEGRSCPLLRGSTEKSAQPQNGKVSLLKAETASVVMENGTGKDPITEGGDRRSAALSGKGDTGSHQHTDSGLTKPQTVQTETLAQIPTQTLAEPQKHTGQDTLMNKGKEIGIIRRIFYTIKVKLSVSIIQHSFHNEYFW